MKKFAFLIVWALCLPLFSGAQEKDSLAMSIDERQGLHQAYADTKAGLDTVKPDFTQLTEKMEQLILLDDKIFNEQLPKKLESIDEMKSKLDENKASLEKLQLEQASNKLYFLIAAGATGLMFLLFLIFLIVMIIRGGKLKKLKKQIKASDEVLQAAQDKAAENERGLNEQIAAIKKEKETLNATLEQERKTFRNKEAEYTSQVTLIEEKIKKASLKESELNYQVFQLELRLKNELEDTVKQKCEAENKVVDLERLLAEAKQHLEEEKNRPHGDESAFNDLRSKVEWLEGESGYLRQTAENEKLAKENLENELRTKQGELDGVYHERDELRGKMNDLQNQVNHLEEQMRNSGQNDSYLQELNNRIADLEGRLNEAYQEKDRLRGQIDELMRFMDKFRQ